MADKIKIEIEEKTFDGISRIKVLQDLKFEIKSGEFICILGPSGCGKSTLLRILSGLDKKFKGQTEISTSSCSFVFQEPRLLPWSNVKESIMFGIKDSRRYEKTYCELINILKLKKYEKLFSGQLSGGMAQRVSLARALISSPKLLLLDEPFASLDKFTRIELQRELKEIMKIEKTTVLMVTHDVEEALFLADRIIILSEKPSKVEKVYEFDIPKIRTSKEFIGALTEIYRFLKIF